MQRRRMSSASASAPPTLTPATGMPPGRAGTAPVKRGGAEDDTSGIGMRWPKPHQGPSLVTVFVVLLSVGGPGTGPAGADPGPGPLEPASGALFGAYVKPRTGWTRDEVVASLERLERDLGRTLDIDHHYHPWTVPFPSWKEPWDLANGRIPMISWGNVSTRRVNSGALDGLIRSRAEAVRSFGAPMFIRWFFEMDSDAVARLAGSPASYINAWRRIRWIFGTAGAWNAVWVWCPTSWGFFEGEAQKYYPGDQYVDWICSDGYNWAPGRGGSRWREFSQIYQAFYEFGVSRGKPMMAGEYGCQERAPGEKAGWFDQAREDIKERFPELDAVVYFDSDRDYDWRVDTSPSSYQSFITTAQDPHFNPPGPLGEVDPGRFDGVLADTTAPRVQVRTRPLWGGRPGVVRWRSHEPHQDVVRLRYTVRGRGGRSIVRSTSDDGRLVWRVHGALTGKRIQVSVRATDLAGNVGTGRSGWFKVR